jgi:predicted nucleic acid-binding Zn finger protein
MVVSCDADELKDIMQEIKASGKADYVRFVRS